jgi:Tfp pilus assembly protein PilW
MNTSKIAGFSMTELLLGVSVQAIVIGAALAIMGQSSDTYDTTSRLGLLQEQASHATEDIARELRLADGGAVLITQENGADRIDFRVPVDFVSNKVVWSTQITFKYVPSSVDVNKNGIADEGHIVRIQDGRERVLCNNVQSGGFKATLLDGTVTLQLDMVTADTPDKVYRQSVEVSASLRN